VASTIIGVLDNLEGRVFWGLGPTLPDGQGFGAQAGNEGLRVAVDMHQRDIVIGAAAWPAGLMAGA
jgi:hypothetical protein